MRDREIAASAAHAQQRWWAVMFLLLLLIVTPGPAGSLYSGLPFAPLTLVVFVVAAILTVFSGFFAPRSAVRSRWLVVLLVLVSIKALLALDPVERGWRGEYSTRGVGREWSPVRFQGTFFRIEDHRVDERLEFDGPSWRLHFINDLAAHNERTDGRRDEARPLRVRWTGHVHPDRGTPVTTYISAAGRVTVQLDDEPPVVMVDPDRQSFERLLTADPHRISVEYDKPAGTRPRLRVVDFPEPVTASAASPGALAAAEWRRRAAIVAGLLALLVVAIAFVGAYAPITGLLLADLWAAPMKTAPTLFFAFFVTGGLMLALQAASSTTVLTAGDDWLAYAGQAREVVFNGLLMNGPAGAGQPFQHEPFYSYMLAAAHLVFGEAFASVIMFNFLCLAGIGLALYFLLRRYVSGAAMAVTLIAAGAFVQMYQASYARTAFSDNLYILLVMITLAAAVSAIERRSVALMGLTGILSGLSAATRPSFLVFVPLFVGVLAAAGELGRFGRRAAHVISFSVGFVSALAPFTIRNWIVSHRFVVLVSSFMLLPILLYPPGQPVPPHLFASDSLLASLGDFVDVWRERPLETASVEARKLLFTMGLMTAGPVVAVPRPRTLVVWPILFGLALWAGRLPPAPRRVLLAFAVSHVLALIIGAPWAYGYKAILPLHLACLAGAAFLLPNWGVEWWRARADVPRRLPPSRPTVSVVLPTYNERDSIRRVIGDFFATGLVTEVLVINNNAVEGTSQQVAGTGAREILEPRQGYGAAIRRGLVEAQGELIVVCEPDGSFLARDITKLIAFAPDFDVVYGSRTQQQLIWHGANMGAFLRWGNWAVAKYMEFLYNATSLTDVGCTMRLLRRDVAEKLRDKFTIEGSQFGPEMMVLSLQEQFRVIQVPVNYLPRVGESAVTGDLGKAFFLGLQMIWLITSRRFAPPARGDWRPERVTQPEGAS